MSKLKTVAKLFEGRHFDREVILLCVRWYLRFKLSLRDLVEMMEMMAERGLSLAHTTIMRWVQHYNRSSKSVGIGMLLRWGAHGASTRHTSRFEACGTTYIVPWTGRPDGRLQAEH